MGKRHWIHTVALVVFASLMSACGGGTSTSTTPSAGAGGGISSQSTVSGVAAISAPATNATVTASCLGTATASVTTNSITGAFSLSVPTTALPCALRVSGGSLPAGMVLYSIAGNSGASLTANITLLTELIIARAAQTAGYGSDPTAWFNSITDSRLTETLSKLSDALVAWQQAFTVVGNYGVVLPAGFSPLTTSFVAAVGNP
jgi:hypothetical protein